MKIFYIANARIPTEKAHGVQIMKMCEAFARLGHEVRLIVPKRKSHISEEAFAYYGIPKSFEILYLPSVDLISLSGLVPKVFSWLQNYTFAKSVGDHLKNNQAELILTRDELTALSLPPSQTILEIHNLSRILKSKAAKLNRLKRIISITHGLKSELVKLGYDRSKIEVLPDGVDLAQFKPESEKLTVRKQLGLPEDKKIIMYTGNFFPWKGVYTLAGAAQHLPDDYLVVFVGGSPFELKNFKEFTDSKQLSSKILTLGHLPYAQMPNYLESADILALPNSALADISKSYTSPLKMFEYMAAGKPIVASDLPSIKEILNDNNAIFVKPDDFAALAEGIKKALTDEELAQRIGEQAFQDVQQYDWSKRVEKILRLA